MHNTLSWVCEWTIRTFLIPDLWTTCSLSHPSEQSHRHKQQNAFLKAKWRKVVLETTWKQGVLSSNETSKVQSIVNKHSVEPQPMKIYVSINVDTDIVKGEFGNNSAFLWGKDVKKSKEIFSSVAFRQSNGYWYYLTSIHTFIGALLQRTFFLFHPTEARMKKLALHTQRHRVTVPSYFSVLYCKKENP